MYAQYKVVPSSVNSVLVFCLLYLSLYMHSYTH